MSVAVQPPRLLLRRRVEVAGEGFAAVAGTLVIGVAGRARDRRAACSASC